MDPNSNINTKNYVVPGLDYDENTPIPPISSYRLSRELRDTERLDWNTYQEGTTDETGAGRQFPGVFAACSSWVTDTPHPGPTGDGCVNLDSQVVKCFRLWRPGIDNIPF